MLQLSAFIILSFFFFVVMSNGLPHKVSVEEGQDAVLLFSLGTKKNIEKEVFDLKKDGRQVFFHNGQPNYIQGLSGQDKQFEGRVSHDDEELKNGIASIKIRNTKMADNGNYTIIFPHLQPPQQFIIELVVEPVFKDCSGENPIACRKPSVKPLKSTNDQALLQCEVKGASPEPKVEWRNSSGNILHADEPQVTKNEDGSYDIILQTTVTETDTYSCVVTQDAICPQINSSTYVHIHEKVCKDSSVKDNTGWFAGPAIGAVGVMFIALVLTLSIPSLRYKVIDSLRRLQPRPEEDIQMDPVPEEPEPNPVDEYHDDPGSGDPGSRRDSGISQTSNGSMLN